MALQCNITTRHGLILENAYSRISYIHGDKETIVVEVAIYPSKLLRDINKDAVEVKSYVIPLDLNFNGNSYKFAYAELKKMDEFMEATDV